MPTLEKEGYKIQNTERILDPSYSDLGNLGNLGKTKTSSPTGEEEVTDKPIICPYCRAPIEIELESHVRAYHTGRFITDLEDPDGDPENPFRECRRCSHYLKPTCVKGGIVTPAAVYAMNCGSFNGKASSREARHLRPFTCNTIRGLGYCLGDACPIYRRRS